MSYIMDFVQKLQLTNLVMILLCFLIATLSAVNKTAFKLVPVIFLLYSIILLTGSHFIAGTIGSAKLKGVLTGELNIL